MPDDTGPLRVFEMPSVSDPTYGSALAEAIKIFESRQSVRRGVFARSGVRGQAFHIYAKAERVFRTVQAGELPDPDELLDLINYAAFAYALAELAPASTTEMTLNGSWPWGVDS